MIDERAARYQEIDQGSVTRPAWSPAQAIALVIGIALIVLGGVALARTGFHSNPIPHTTVAGLDHTPWLGVIELAFGVLILAMGAMPGADRGGMVLAGVVGIAGGLIIAIQPETFHRVLGVHQGNGILYVIIGAILLATAMLAPVYSSRTRSAGAVTQRDATAYRDDLV